MAPRPSKLACPPPLAGRGAPGANRCGLLAGGAGLRHLHRHALTAAAALALGRLCSPGKAAGKWAAFLCLGSCLAESAYFANRTPAPSVRPAPGRTGLEMASAPTGEPKLRRCAGILFALLFLALALRGNLGACAAGFSPTPDPAAP
ncbi:MAG: DUF4094 domain-containing protein [Oscillospiraceae bacterium]